MNISIIDYGTGNISSIQRKIQQLGFNSKIASESKQLLSADKIILPGVGHFAAAMAHLEKSGLNESLNELALIKKKPVLGICLGMQLMAKYSSEGDANGLNWFNANVKKFNIEQTYKFKIPHVGWNTVTVTNKDNILMKGILEDDEFYFIHSYHMSLDNKEDEISSTNYETPFTSSINKENIFGVQYHPEKSRNSGSKIIKNFLDI